MTYRMRYDIFLRQHAVISQNVQHYFVCLDLSGKWTRIFYKYSFATCTQYKYSKNGINKCP